jgi:hypothetical protein
VAGTVSGDTFAALAGQTGQVTNTISTTIRDVAFSWTGGNSDPNTGSWISGFTNRIGAQNVARVTIAPVSGVSLTTTGIADLDGGWRTAPIHLEIGTYTVTMQVFLASDTGFTTPLTPATSTLVLTEAPCFAAGTLIRTASGLVPVDALCIGDHVWARGRGFVPVVWLGHRRVESAATPSAPAGRGATCCCRPTMPCSWAEIWCRCATS